MPHLPASALNDNWYNDTCQRPEMRCHLFGACPSVLISQRENHVGTLALRKSPLLIAADMIIDN